MKKYSSFKKQQILTENFRRFINEGWMHDDAWDDIGNWVGEGSYGTSNKVIVKPEWLADRMTKMILHKKPTLKNLQDLQDVIVKVATDYLDLEGEACEDIDDRGLTMPTSCIWPEEHKKATLEFLRKKIADDDLYAGAEKIIMDSNLFETEYS